MAATPFAIAYTEKALASLGAIPSTKLRRQVKAKIYSLTVDPHPAGVAKVHGAIHTRNSVFRLRSGDYRVLFCLQGGGSEILVLDIGHRKDVYRKI